MEESKQINEFVAKEFSRIYGGDFRLFRAPGRVNLIGEHTDYNDGFVLPFAIDRETIVAARTREDLLVNVHALDVAESTTFNLHDPAKKHGNWIDYVEGTARSLHQSFNLKHGADLVFSSSVPIGGGLSSSAALEVSIGYALLSLNIINFDKKELAFAAQRAEHEYVGIRSGIMDQFTSVFGKAGHALLLDCRSLQIGFIPLALDDAVIAVCNSGVKHELASSEYNKRREECETGVEILSKNLPGIKSLRDVRADDFLEYSETLPETIRKRCRHVISENARTVEAAELFKSSDVIAAGMLMFQSHRSLRHDYEVSSPELDLLVDTAAECEGVFGARMTGGGFGGCTVNLLASASLEDFKETITREYSKTFGFEPSIYIFQAADGASETALTGMPTLPIDPSVSDI
ncbi:MAG: galactokinase [Pyrinomonadaceae bacterium]